MGWVLIYLTWNEERSAMVYAYVCCWLIACETSVQPSWTRDCKVHALDLSVGFGDIEKVLRNILDKKIFALSRKQQYNHFI